MAMSTALNEDAFASLAAAFSGVLLRPADAGYEDARRLHNGLIDKRPALIARCRGTADIVDAVNFAREHGFEVSVRGGGHNVAGRAVVDGGVMIDLSPMKGIHVNPSARTVRAQGGVTWREFNREAAVHGLATTGGVVSTTGIAGLTLGGGVGWLLGKYGLSVDNVLSIEVVTAAGEVLHASEDAYPDLFWALRGGGGNFGIASSFSFRAHPLRDVFGGRVAHPFSAAREMLRFYRNVTASAPDELAVTAVLTHAPDGSGAPLAAMVICHCGSPAQAENDVRPILGFGTPVLVQVDSMPYPVMNTIIDDAFPRGTLGYWKSSFVRELSDDAIDTMVECFGTCPSPMSTMVIEHFHGAATRIGVSDTAVPHREAGYNFLILSLWHDPATTDRNIAWTRAVYGDLEPYYARRRYVNYLDNDERADAVRSAYGPNYARLAAIKRTYDPGNLFHLNQNIEPEEG
jgi:FAD/FMN-containing dehydrogenase